MKFYVKVTKDNEQVFEGWNTNEDYQKLIDDIFSSDLDLIDYNVKIEDYESLNNCGCYLLEEFENTDLETLEKLLELSDGLESAEEFYNELNDTSDIFYEPYLDFDEDTINEIFKTPYEALRACYFGKVSFNDPLFTFDGYANIKTVSEIPYDERTEEIMKQWMYEKI
ncbi:hypothetical protein [Granulicatella adiacens]